MKQAMYRRADGRYQAQITIEEHGKKKQKYFYGKTPQEVRRKMVAYQQPAAEGCPFSHALELWQERHFSEIRHGTRMSYAPACKRALETFGGTPIGRITPGDVNRSILQMAGQRYSHQSVKVYLSVLNQVFRFAMLSGWLENNPAAAVRLPKGLPKAVRELPDDCVLRTVQSSLGAPFGLFPFLLLHTGLRRGEALALTYEDIDFERRTIRVDKTLYYENNRPRIRHATKTQAGTRTVILTDHLAAALRQHMAGSGLTASASALNDPAASDPTAGSSALSGPAVSASVVNGPTVSAPTAGSSALSDAVVSDSPVSDFATGNPALNNSAAPAGLLFEKDGQPLSEQEFQARWRKYCTATGLMRETPARGQSKAAGRKPPVLSPSITPHQLRHAYATLLFEAGVDEKDAQQLLGHTKLSVTRDIYTHIRSNRTQATAQRLNEYLVKSL